MAITLTSPEECKSMFYEVIKKLVPTWFHWAKVVPQNLCFLK